jgi:4'-phosphopantetheinyl transferase
MIIIEYPKIAQSVDVWTLRLDASASVSRAFRDLLSSDEILRADRFAFERLRSSFAVSHGALRVLLAQYMKCSPRELKFTSGPKGKPALRGNSQLQFNMAHSGGLAVYAFLLGSEIGVDIEEVRGFGDFEQIAARYFCRAEASQLLSIVGRKQREEAFYRCWTRKESYLKAVGEGLSVPLDQFQVTLLPDSPVRFIHIGNQTSEASSWTLQHLEPAPGYTGALAYRGAARTVVLHPPQHAQDFLDLLHPGRGSSAEGYD